MLMLKKTRTVWDTNNTKECYKGQSLKAPFDRVSSSAIGLPPWRPTTRPKGADVNLIDTSDPV